MDRCSRTVVVLLLATVATAAFGAVGTDGAYKKAQFREADRNRSGSVSFEEFVNYAVNAFHDLDVDHDSVVTPKEYHGIKDPVTIKDFNVALHDHFDTYDADRNGSLDLREWNAVPEPRNPPQS